MANATPSPPLFDQEFSGSAKNDVWHNKGNDDGTSTTPLQILQGCEVFEPAWARHRNSKSLSKETSSQRVIDAEKLTLVNNMCENYEWDSYPQYERCSTFYKDAKAMFIQRGRHQGSSIWDALSERFIEEVDGTALVPGNYKYWFKLVADAMRILKREASEAVVEIAMLGLPRSGKFKFVSSLLPEGIPVLRSDEVSDTNMRQLIKDMSDSKALEKIEEDDKKLEKGGESSSGGRGRGRGVAKKKARGKFASSCLGIDPNAAACDTPVPLTEEEKNVFWLMLDKQKRDLQRVYSSTTPCAPGDMADCFMRAVIYSTLAYKKRELTYCISGVRRNSNSLLTTRQLFTLTVCKQRKLKPRTSDADFPDGDLAAVESQLVGSSQVAPDSAAPTEDSLREMEDRVASSAAELVGYLQVNKVFERAPAANRKIAEASLSLTNRLFAFTEADPKGHTWASPKECYDALIRFACETMHEIIPPTFDSVVELGELSRSSKKEVLQTIACKTVMEKLTKDTYNALQAQAFFQLISSYGVHTTPVKQGPNVEQVPYLPPLVVAVIQSFLMVIIGGTVNRCFAVCLRR